MVTTAENPQLLGLVLAGGRSTRMGSDKGSLSYGATGLPQVAVAVELLEQVCDKVYVSISAEQQRLDTYANLATIVDRDPDRGPAGGLVSAFRFEPDAAWLVLAVDMPRVSVNQLSNLVEQRDCDRIATVHCHADGALEPLCAIWEPRAVALVQRELDLGRGSLRAVAQSAEISVVRLPEPERLANINTPQQRLALLHEAQDAGVDSDDP